MWKVMPGEKLFEIFQKKIVVQYMEVELARAKRVFDFLPVINKTPGDEKILKTWTDFFTSKKVPFIVVEENGKRSLWKEEIVSWRE